jgi:POT family proton-dependent oligopeptide transporter
MPSNFRSTPYKYTNIAGLSSVASTYLEKKCGFWTAYLLAFSTIWVGLALLLVNRKEYSEQIDNCGYGHLYLTKTSKLNPQYRETSSCRPARYSPIRHAIILIYLDAAKPSFQLMKYSRTVPWSDHFIKEIRLGLLACRVM